MGEDRSIFEKICKTNLDMLEHGIKKLIKILQPETFRVFVVSGYDDRFEIIKCDTEAMISDIATQVLNSFNLNSKIYELV